jgi:hypothetical protein
MATIKDVFVRRPWWHSPAFWIAIVVLAAVAAVLSANATAWNNHAVPSLPSSQRETNRPAVVPAVPNPQVPAVVAPVVPAWPRVVVWQEIPSGSIPAEKFSFVPGATIRTELGFPAGGVLNGYRNGIAFFIQTGELRDRKFFFTPDGGKNWFHVNPPLDHTVSTLQPVGVLEGETAILFAVTEPYPWVLKYWRAEIPLAMIKGLSP